MRIKLGELRRLVREAASAQERDIAYLESEFPEVYSQLNLSLDLPGALDDVVVVEVPAYIAINVEVAPDEREWLVYEKDGDPVDLSRGWPIGMSEEGLNSFL